MTLDESSRLLTACAGDSAEKMEQLAKKKGLTTGYKPKEQALNIGEALALRIPNRLAAVYGEIDELCAGLKAAVNGQSWVSRNIPRSATGPDLKKILIGSRGRFGEILEATFRLFPRPETRRQVILRWSRPKQGEELFRRMDAAGIRYALLNESNRTAGICLEGLKADVQARLKVLRRIIAEVKGTMT